MIQKILGLLFAFLLLLGPVSNGPAVEKRTSSIALDTSYTIDSIRYLGLGAGANLEIGFLDIFSFVGNVGYENYSRKYSDSSSTNFSFLFYWTGLRLYMTYDAVSGPYAGLFFGARQMMSPDRGTKYMIPVELGWKFLIDKPSGFYVEPLARVMLYPDYNPNGSTNGLYISSGIYFGANVGCIFSLFE